MIIRICCSCHKLLGFRWTRRWKLEIIVSHGYCQSCADAMIAAMDP